MTHNDPEFLDYLAGLDTETSLSTKKEIDVTAAAALKEIGLKRKLSGKRKAGRVLLIAAAIAVGAVVTAAAAGVNIGDMFRGYFEHSDPYFQKSASPTLTLNQVDLLNKSGTPINQNAESNGTTITLRSAISDKNSVYVLFDVIAPKGTKLNSSGRYDFEKMDPMYDSFNRYSDLTFSVQAQPDSNLNDNKKTFILQISSNDDLRNQAIRLSFSNLVIIDNKHEQECPVLKGNWKFTFTLKGNAKSKVITVNKEIHYTGQDKIGSPNMVTIKCTVDTINLSPLSATIRFTGLKGAQDYQIPQNFSFQDKAGKKHSVKSTGGMDDSKMLFCTRTYLFNSPIDLNSISSITIGDLTVPVS